MSSPQKTFIYWFAFIAASLIITSTIGLIGMYRNLGIAGERIHFQEQRITEIKNYHNKDVTLIREDIRDIKNDQRIIKNDIALILRKIE